MKIDYIKNQIKVAGMVIACTSLCSCNSEIEDGTTDIDSWPLPRIEVTYPTEFEHPGVVFTVEDIERFRKIATQQIQVSVSAILSCRPFFILIFLLCIKMKHYGFSRKSIWKNLETFP